MKFLDYINSNTDKKVEVYFDMDGVFAELDFGNFDYKTIRPIKTVLTLMKILHDQGVDVKVLSICRTNEIVKGKIEWLKINASFLEEKNIYLLSKEENPGIESKDLKTNFLKENTNEDHVIIHVDDDITIIKQLQKETPNVKVFHVSSVIE